MVDRSRHVIVTGPGKAGASLLMYMLTELDIDTGFPKGRQSNRARKIDFGGRYEKQLRGSTIIKRPYPYVLKEPAMCADIDLRIERLKLHVEHIYILLRRPGPLANALEFMRRGTSRKEQDYFERQLAWGDVEKMARALNHRVTQVVHLVAEMDIPHTLVSYPRFAAEPRYAYNKFDFLMKRHNITWERFQEVHHDCVDPEQVKHAYDNMPEWCRAMMRENPVFKPRP